MKTRKTYLITGAVFFTLLLLWLGYLSPREAFVTNFSIYAILFALLYGFVYRSNLSESQLIPWLFFGLALRLGLVLAIPQLSDDYFRFIWDGKLLLSGINPYQYTPGEILPALLDKDAGYFQHLFDQLNSPNYFSVYPPTNQFFFAVASWVGGNDILLSIVTLRTVLIAFEAGVLILLWKIAFLIRVDRKQILLYGLNPLVILEISGNLHFEGVMLFFLLLALYSFLKNEKKFGVWFGMAVGIKLTPLILSLLWLRSLKGNQVLVFIMGAGLAVFLVLSPLLGSYHNFLESIQLYYGKFEFNAGIYYLVRHISMWWIPYNPIGYISPILTGLTAILLAWVAWRKPLPTIFANIVLTYLIYLMLHTVVHPWYLIVPLGVSVLTPYRIFFVWSFVIFVSYASYVSPETKESTILLLVQYAAILCIGYFDFIKPKSNK